MLGSFAEFERSMIRERTRAGLAAAREDGRVAGHVASTTSNGARLRMLCLGASVGSRYGTSVRCQPGDDLADSGRNVVSSRIGAPSAPTMSHRRMLHRLDSAGLLTIPCGRNFKLKAGTNAYHRGLACPSKTSTLLGNSSATRKGITKRHRRCETVQHPEAIKGTDGVKLLNLHLGP
jgi:hypothetical protein